MSGFDTFDFMRQIRDSSLDHNKSHILHCMLLRADKDTGVVIWTSHKLLAADAKLHAKTVSKALRELALDGILPAPTTDFAKSGLKINRYQLGHLRLPAGSPGLPAGGGEGVCREPYAPYPPCAGSPTLPAGSPGLPILPLSTSQDTTSQEDDSKVIPWKAPWLERAEVEKARLAKFDEMIRGGSSEEFIARLKAANCPEAQLG